MGDEEKQDVPAEDETEELPAETEEMPPQEEVSKEAAPSLAPEELVCKYGCGRKFTGPNRRGSMNLHESSHERKNRPPRRKAPSSDDLPESELDEETRPNGRARRRETSDETMEKVGLDEKAGLAGDIDALIARALKMSEAARDEFRSNLSRLRTFRTQLRQKNIPRDTFDVILSAIEEIEPALNALDDQDAEESGRSQDYVDKALEMERKKAEREMKMQELELLRSGGSRRKQSSDDDDEVGEFIIEGRKVKMKTSTWLMYRQQQAEKEEREERRRREEEERRERWKLEQERSKPQLVNVTGPGGVPMQIPSDQVASWMMTQYQVQQQEREGKRAEELRLMMEKEKDERRSREEQWRMELKQREDQFRQQMEVERKRSEDFLNALNKSKLDQVEKERDEFLSAARESPGTRMKRNMDELKEAGIDVRVGGSPKPDEVEARAKDRAAETGTQILKEGFDSMKETVKTAQTNMDRRMSELKKLWLAEREKSATQRGLPPPPPVTQAEMDAKALEWERRLSEGGEAEAQRIAKEMDALEARQRGEPAKAAPAGEWDTLKKFEPDAPKKPSAPQQPS